MKRLITFLILLLLGNLAHTQNCNIAPGTKTLYKPRHLKYTPTPKGYRAVFLNYAGRHGARHLTKEVNTTYAWQLLVKTDSLHVLTTQGRKLRTAVMNLARVEKGNIKGISQEGREELQDIAHRMKINFPSLFIGNKPAFSITKELRTRQSALAFLTGLSIGMDSGNIRMDVRDTSLRFYDLSPSYLNFEEKGSWKETIASFRKAMHVQAEVRQIIGGIFTASFIGTLTDAQLERFVTDLFDFYSISFSIRTEADKLGIKTADMDFARFFSCRQLHLLTELDEAEDFLLKGPGFDNEGIQVKIAAPLLSDFLHSTEDFLTAKDPAAIRLRFCHAETIAPFAALLRIKGASETVQQLEGFTKAWNASTIVPLSANIQWIVYRNEQTHDLRIRILLNEKEVAINGLPAGDFPYYKWSDVQQLYTASLQRLGYFQSTSDYEFLQRLH